MEDTTMQSTLGTLEVTGQEEQSFYNRESTLLPLETLIPSAITIIIVIIVAIVGNIMTIIAYMSNNALHNVYNYFIFHLAIADLLLASVSMPLHTIYLFKGNMWPFGEIACKTYIAFDYGVCLQTNLLMIYLSVDRLLLISLGMKYSRVVTMKKAHILMALSWPACFILYFPSIFGWEPWRGEAWVPYDVECDVEWAAHALMMTLSSMFDPILLMLALAILNILIYSKIRNRNKVKPKQEVSVVQTTKTATVTSAAPSAVTNVNDSNKDGGGKSENAETLATNENHNDKTKQEKARRDTKALRFLALLVILFFIAWGPYTIMLIITSFCETKCFNMHVQEFLIWLLWTKSAVNPFLYAYNSQVYKDKFKKYVTIWKRLPCC